ncbi:MAG TPA: SelT/SelW/SelH family protein [Nocardioidaceae bacterium]|nr:SelT/SelW/SelH family protein [Nocardioidaceae bacterium]
MSIDGARIEINYCTQCRWLMRAAWMAQELLTTFESDLAEVALIPGTGGIFEVRVDGQTVWSRKADGGFPEPKELKQRVRDLIAPRPQSGPRRPLTLRRPSVRRMRAIAFQEYGGSDRLELADLPEPKVGPDIVLVRVRAAGVNPVDWKIREGLVDGAHDVYFPVVPGWDVAGVVETVGPAVTEFASGDEVMGYVRRDEVRRGTYAELTPAPIRGLAAKPASASWPEAGGLPLVGLTALQALIAGRVGDGDTVLIHAAAGGVGHLAVQIAQALGAARVIGTASPANHAFLAGLGAEPVEYGPGLADRLRDLAPGGIDAACDFVGGDAVEISGSVVSDPGRIVSITNPPVVKQAGGRYIFVRPNAEQLTRLAGWYDEGRLRVHVDRTFPLAEAAAAQDLVREGHVRGKVVLEV